MLDIAKTNLQSGIILFFTSIIIRSDRSTADVFVLNLQGKYAKVLDAMKKLLNVGRFNVQF